MLFAFPHGRGTRATRTSLEPRCHFQSQKGWSSQSKSFLCLTPSPMLGISVIDDSWVITWCFCSACSLSLGARRCFSGCSCPAHASLAQRHQWHVPGSLPRAPCTISHASCSPGTQLSKPNGLWEHKDGKFLVLSSAESSGSSALSYRTHPSLPRLKVCFWWSDSMWNNSEHSAWTTLRWLFPLLNGIFLIPNLCVLGCVDLLLLFKQRSSNRNPDISPTWSGKGDIWSANTKPHLLSAEVLGTPTSCFQCKSVESAFQRNI